MLKLTMNWKDDNTNIMIQQEDANYNDETALCYSVDADSGFTTPADIFKNVLTSVGYSPYTVAKYMINAGLNLLSDVTTLEGFDDCVKQLCKEWGVQND